MCADDAFRLIFTSYLGLQASVRQSRELQAEWQHKYISIQGESAIMKHELDDVTPSPSPMSLSERLTTYSHAQHDSELKAKL